MLTRSFLQQAPPGPEKGKTNGWTFFVSSASAFVAIFMKAVVKKIQGKLFVTSQQDFVALFSDETG